eukprot:403334662
MENQEVLDYDQAFDDIGDHPLFVTYNLNDKLRGCIGTFKADKLGKQLQSYSLVAALYDKRFNPLSKKELQQVQCEISLLTEFEKINDVHEWEVGKHGLEIEFKDPEDEEEIFRATFLPHIASQQKWNQKTTVVQLIRKAGYFGDIKHIIDKFTLIRRYQSTKFGYSYQEYIQEVKATSSSITEKSEQNNGQNQNGFNKKLQENGKNLNSSGDESEDQEEEKTQDKMIE